MSKTRNSYIISVVKLFLKRSLRNPTGTGEDDVKLDIKNIRGCAVAQLVEALRHKREGGGIDSR